MEKYKVGTKVKLSPDSEWNRQIQHDEEGKELIGEIIRLNQHDDPEYYPYRVEYPNGYYNDYNHKDLVLVEGVDPIYEIY